MKTRLTHHRRGVRAPAQTPAFNPALPEDGSLILAGVLRDQFNALQAEVLQRATLDELNDAVAALEAEIAQRTTQAQVNETVYQGIDTAVATVLPQTSANSNAVSPLSSAALPYYDQTQAQSVMDKVDELINTLRR